MAARLEVFFIEDEVFAADSDLNGDKASGLDGFPGNSIGIMLKRKL